MTTHATRRHRRFRSWFTTLGIAALAIVIIAPVVDAASPKTKRVSIKTGGGQANDNSQASTTSANGRFVAFASTATNLIGSDTNGATDVFVHDRRTKKTKRVSIRNGGGEANRDSFNPSISADGRFVAFVSFATNLIGSDTNDVRDVYVHDRKTKKTKRVSIKTGGGEGNDESEDAAISADGRFVAFRSAATNLIGSDTNGKTDVFVHDRQKKRTKRVSIKTGGTEANENSTSAAISANGRFIAFASFATNLIGSDTNGKTDVFVHDRKMKKTKRASTRNGGGETNGTSVAPSISADGRFIAFSSFATNVIGSDTNGVGDIFVRERRTKKTKRVSIPNGGGETNDHSSHPSISANGRFVAFASEATNLISSDTNGSEDIFVRDRNTKKTKRASKRNGGGEANFRSFRPTISADARFVAFASEATNLVGGDTNGKLDVFLRGPIR